MISKKTEFKACQNMPEILAEEIGAGFSQLSWSFQHINGQTIDAYWQSLRMEKAKEWLSYPSITITEMAYWAGYNSLQSFSKAFKSATGQSPSLFRKNKPIKRKTLNSL